jgi:two-component system, chemotaxis family, protein-glutamate methylesterase/glutaminase
VTPQIVVIGTSSGGLSALQVLLPGLGEKFPCPLVIAQHRGRDGVGGLREYMQKSCPLPIEEPEDKAPIEPGRVYLAPHDYHLLVEKGHFALSIDAPVWHARPSINVLFESAADAYAELAVGVILSGVGGDGARGLAVIKERGGSALVEDPATAAYPAMPQAALAATSVDRVLPLSEIAPFLKSICQAGVRCV